MVTVETRVEAAGPGGGADRVESFTGADGSTVIVLADGAGGTGAAGARAAEVFVARVRAALTTSTRLAEVDLAALVDETDRVLHADGRGGQTTAVIAVVTDGRVRGASVGDSEAWLVPPEGDDVLVLTAAQARKPLVGSGAAAATGFGPTLLSGTLVVGSDGLFKYAARAAIVRTARAPAEVDRLVQLVRLPSGRLQDDVSVAICRAPPPAQIVSHSGSGR